jgi:hypothetical protein
VSTGTIPPGKDPGPAVDPARVLAIVHHHPGRLRVRAEALEDESPAAAAAIEALQGVPGVTRVDHNAQTGSLLVEYEPGLAEPDAIVERIAHAANLVSPFDPRARLPPTQPANTVIGGTQKMNLVAFELTGKRADLRTIVPAALAGAAAYSFAFGRGPRLPRWDNLLYWSYSIFAALHHDEIARTTGADVVPPDGGAE